MEMCEKCRGVGYVSLAVPMSDPRFGKAMPCSCQDEKRKLQAQRKLEALDGLTPEERGHRFATTTPTSAQAKIHATLSAALTGIYVLEGKPGIGKSHYLHCTVNQARERGRVAIYATMPDILDYLRAAFNPKLEESYEDRWQQLISCEVLAIDELDEFNSTPWANERFLRLIDERWRKRADMLTIIGMNGKASLLLPKVASRLTQGSVFEMVGKDLRPLFKTTAVAAERVPA